jgi:hypothetical protein
MGGPARRARGALFAVAVLLGIGASVGTPAPGARDYATVGRIVTRVVDGRTVVIVPIAGPMRVRLSEPFRLRNRSRLYLTIIDAKLGIPAPPRRGEGVLGLQVTETGVNVRIAIDLAALGDYGMKPTEGGILLWVDPEPPLRPSEAMQGLPAIPAGTLPEGSDAPAVTGGRGIALLVLAGLAAGAGIGARRLRAKGGVEALKDRFETAWGRVVRRSAGAADR